jgi:hypothetical protein
MAVRRSPEFPFTRHHLHTKAILLNTRALADHRHPPLSLLKYAIRSRYLARMQFSS